jgi:uncharacterized protein (TIGR00369 family)
MKPVLTLPELETLLDDHAPRWRELSRITALAERTLSLHMPFRPDLLRAGDTISGPALMTLADRAAYYLTLALAGPVPEAVTASLDIHFLERPGPCDVTAVATMLRLGRRLAVSQIDLRSRDRPVAHAVVTYALPARRSRAVSDT